MQGGREDVPMTPAAGGIGGMIPPPPQGGAPMPPPPQGGMMPPTMAEQMPMQEEMPMEEPVSIEQDAAALAEAVIGRAGGDPQAAVAILDTAAQMIMQTSQEEPMMAAGGGYMKKPKYAANGEYLGEESELLRQMIMDDMQTGRTLSDADIRQGYFDPDTGEMITDVTAPAEDTLQPLYDYLEGEGDWGPMMSPNIAGRAASKLIQWNQNRLRRQQPEKALTQLGRRVMPASPMDERVEAHLARMDRDPASFATDSVRDMFDMAFREARERGDEVFEFMGEMYNTRTAEEEAAMTPEELTAARRRSMDLSKINLDELVRERQERIR